MNAKELFMEAIRDEIEEIRKVEQLVEKRKEEEINEIVKGSLRVDIRRSRPWLLGKLKDKSEYHAREGL